MGGAANKYGLRTVMLGWFVMCSIFTQSWSMFVHVYQSIQITPYKSMHTYYPDRTVCQPPYAVALMGADAKSRTAVGGTNGAMMLMLPRVVCSSVGLEGG